MRMIIMTERSDRSQRQIREAPLGPTQPSEEAPEYIISGVAIVFDKLTKLWRNEYEKIAPEAVDNALLRGDDAVLLFNHDPNYTISRISAGNLRLWKEEDGLHFEGRLDPEISWQIDLWRQVQSGVINKCSFGFRIDEESIRETDEGDIIYTITDLTLFDVSVVTFPAYEDTSAQARSLEQDRPGPEAVDPEADLLRVEFEII